MQLKARLIEVLELEGLAPDDIGDEVPLFGDESTLGLDSVDALELLLAFEKDFGVALDTEEIDPEVFSTVASMERFVATLVDDAG